MRLSRFFPKRTVNRPTALGGAALCMAAVFGLTGGDLLLAAPPQQVPGPPAHSAGPKPPSHAAKKFPKRVKKRPLQLETYKSFFVGGERFTRPDGSVKLSGHAYVEAFIPHTPGKKRPPIIMMHSSISATIWLQRSNGEEGWALLFARAGYPVYVVDPAGTGRASVNLDALTNLSQVTQSNSGPWVTWMHGPAFGMLGFPPHPEVDHRPHPVPMNQMPTDEWGVNQWLGHRMVYSVNPGENVRNAALIALLEKIGEPVIWMGWSAGGLVGQQLVIERPELFKAFALVEGCRPEDPSIPAFIQTVVSHDIPMLHVNPDYAWRAFRPVNPIDRPSGSRCVAVAHEINAKGGNALVLYLPDVGIFGNGHEFMLQNNADEIAQIYLDWLKHNVR
jgi:pimeloyl-ACP methyl ester carboxylesterase